MQSKKEEKPLLILRKLREAMKGAEEQDMEERDKGGIFALLSLGRA